MKVALYARRSVDAEDSRVSVDRQLDLIRALAELSFGERMELVELVDNDAGAGVNLDRRPAFDELVRALRAGELAGIVSSEQSRLTRRPAELEELLDLVDRHGVSWLTLSGPVSAKRGDRTAARIRGVVDADESERASVRASRTHEHSRAAGKPVGPAPYGYRNAGERGRRTREIEPTEALVVRRMVELLVAGSSLEDVARELNGAGILTRAGKPWRGNVIRTTVTNPAIAGVRAHRAVNASGRAGQHFVVDGPALWPAIIETETFERVRELLNARDVVIVGETAHRVGRRGATARRHALSGLLSCSRCELPMRGSRRYLRDGSSVPAYRCARCGMSLDGVKAEELLVETVLAAVAGGVGPRLARFDVDVAELRQERAELLGRRKALASSFGAGKLDAESFEAGVAGIAGRLGDVERRIAELEAPHASIDAASDTLAAWSSSSHAARRLALAAVIERVVVLPAAGRHELADRLVISWRA